jgi:hypothetical protein
MGQLFGRVIGADHLQGDKSFGPPFVGGEGSLAFFPSDGKERGRKKIKEVLEGLGFPR